VLVGIVLGAAALLASTATWVRAETSSAVDATVPLTATGVQAAPGVGAGGLVVVAAALALAIGGLWGRRLAAAGIVLGGAIVVVSCVTAVSAPEASVLRAAQDAVGVAVLTAPARVSAVPWVALVLGAACVVLGLAALVLGRQWGGAGSRHERVATPAPATPDGPGPAEGTRQDDEHAAWDALTRGEDPT
jgi:uncharacterized membrane protein (TIGR02234 family)